MNFRQGEPEVIDSREVAHLLSSRSRRLRRDTFFFLPYLTGSLVRGLNQRVTPVTSAKLQRWARLLDSQTLLVQFKLQPIIVKKCSAVLDYIKEPVGSPINADSTEPLPADDYS